MIAICGIDAHLPGITALKKQFEDLGETVEIACYGNKYCPPNTMGGYDVRQDFIPIDREFHCCDMIAYLSIAKHFYKKYDQVYIAHHDVTLKGNPLPRYEKEMTGKWSFIVPEGKANAGRDSTISYCKKHGSWEALKTNLRLSHELIAISKEFVDYMFTKYKDEKEMWNKEFVNYNMNSDLNMFDLLDYDGFIGKVIKSCVIHKPVAGTLSVITNGKLTLV